MGRVKELFLQMEGVIEELKEENEVLTKKFEEGLALLIQAKNDIEEQLERIEELETENERLKESVAYHTGRPLSEWLMKNKTNERLQKDFKDSKWI